MIAAAAKIASAGLRWVIHAVRQLGPYAAIELLLPGGSLLAIALWLYRRNRLARQAGPHTLRLRVSRNLLEPCGLE